MTVQVCFDTLQFDEPWTLEEFDQILKDLAEAGYEPAFVARPLRRAIQRLIQDPLALELLELLAQVGLALLDALAGLPEAVPTIRSFTVGRDAGLRDGMTVSTHHHLRNGDFVANAVFAAAAELGVKDLRWFPSASFPCHEPQIEHLESGVIHHIEGSMNGPLAGWPT